MVELLKDTIGGPYLWNEQPRAAADRLDFVARAGDIAARSPQLPLLVISGELDFPMLRADAAELVGALRDRYAQPDHVRLTTVANLRHLHRELLALNERAGVAVSDGMNSASCHIITSNRKPRKRARSPEPARGVATRWYLEDLRTDDYAQ